MWITCPLHPSGFKLQPSRLIRSGFRSTPIFPPLSFCFFKLLLTLLTTEYCLFPPSLPPLSFFSHYSSSPLARPSFPSSALSLFKVSLTIALLVALFSARCYVFDLIMLGVAIFMRNPILSFPPPLLLPE